MLGQIQNLYAWELPTTPRPLPQIERTELWVISNRKTRFLAFSGKRVFEIALIDHHEINLAIVIERRVVIVRHRAIAGFK